MSNLNEISVMKEIEINKNHIEQFPMETEEGTKRTKEKFHMNAVNERNIYVQKQHAVFDQYRIECENEMKKRIKELMPQDKSSEYENGIKEVDELLYLVKLNSNISNGFKLGLDFIVASIQDDSSLEDINRILKSFIDKFQDLGIYLSIQDFSYTMFTEQYMSSFLRNSSSDVMKDVFEKIYFTCPDIMMQLKMNLIHILEKYKSQLEKYVVSLKNKLFLEHQVNDNNVIEKYTVVRYQSGNEVAIDPYYNTILFTEGKKKISDYVEGSPTRQKNYNAFASNGNYDELGEEEKKHYNSAVMGLYLTLNELKKYYHYEFILKDLLERYKNKDAAKGQYATKKKELEKEEKTRVSLYKEYQKASGIGLFAKKNETKMKNAMLKMNEHIRKLNTLYEEYRDLDITNKLNSLTESASIYDLFSIALTSFPFLEKCFQKEEIFQEFTLEENVEEYFKFIYNPNNSVLRKVNVFADYDLVSVVAEKYKLLNLVVTSEMIDPDNIDATMESVKFINLIQNIERSPISLHTIDIICQMLEIVGKEEQTSEMI